MKISAPQLAGGLLIVVLIGSAVLSSAWADERGKRPNTTQNNQAHADALARGAEIYASQCAECHGDKGQGVEAAYEKPLGGPHDVAWLTRRIERTMPEGEAELCVGEDAAAVAAYLYEQFYSPEARRANTPKRTLQRLTAEQHRQSLADLIASFRGQQPLGGERGLKAQYYAGRKMHGKPLAEQVDPAVEFTFTPEHPLHAQFDKHGHSVRWTGSLLAHETGEYEIVIRTDHAVRLWFNSSKARGSRAHNEITDSQPAFIDGWLQSAEKEEFRKRVFLVAGRAYPILLEFSSHSQGVGNENDQDKQKHAGDSTIALWWVPPGGVEQVIPERHLSPVRQPAVLAVSAPFPPDDASMGFISGAGVSDAWLAATTQAAVQTADYVTAHLNELAGTRPKAKDRRDRIAAFCHQFVERAYRRPITDAEAQRLIQRHFTNDADLDTAVKRVVLAALISPSFLYPAADTPSDDSFAIASRLALAMWDGLPDEALRLAAAKDQLKDPDQRTAHAKRMLNDPRAQAKLMRFFHHWLELERAEYADKDAKLFPEFDEQLLADLRVSLDLFLEHTVFSKQSDYRELLLADYLYVNERLAAVYGLALDGQAGQGFVRVAVPNNQRSGVITHPYLLTAFAYHNNTSPIHRGVFLTRNIIGRQLNPPPNAIAFEDAGFDPTLTMREKVTEMTRASACMACHETINPLGFSLEHYDSLGRWRTTDKDKPIDAESEFAGDDGQPLRLKGARDVAEFAAGSEAAHRGFVRQLFQHTAQRDPSALEPGTLDQLAEHFQSTDYHIRELYMQIALKAATHGLESGEAQTAPSHKTEQTP